jgi:hypothetical protein
MLLGLLLLTSVTKGESVTITSLTGVYIGLAGTVLASLLAMLGAFRASNKASATSKEVTDLSTQTARDTASLSAQTARDIAALSAQVSRESSALAAQTATDLKEKDYQNDFFKKIIDKRLKAWEEAEALMGMLLNTKVDRGDGKRLLHYFDDKEVFDKILLSMRLLAGKSFWLGKEFSSHLRIFNRALTQARRECIKLDEVGEEIIDEKMLYEAGKKHYLECVDLLNELVLILGRRIIVLHNIEDFFKELDSLGINRE